MTGMDTLCTDTVPHRRGDTLVDPLTAACAIGPAIRAQADATEQLGTLPAAVVDMLDEANLFWLLVPTELGGHGADVIETLRVIEEVSRHDGSTGWSLMANACITGFFAGHCADAALETMYRPGARTILAGMFGPVGHAEPTRGGFIVRGRYSFGSGSSHATAIGGGALLHDENGAPLELIFLVPSDQVTFLGNWDVVGLVGTGSFDYEVEEQFVGSDFVVRRAGGNPRRGQATQRLGLQIIGSAGHAGVALGIAKRAVEELAKVVMSGKRRPGVVPVVEQQHFLHEFARQEAALAAARAFCFEAFSTALDTVTASEPYRELEYQRIRQATTYVTSVAHEVVEFAYHWGGSTGLRHPHPLGRCMRDMHGATQHIYVDTTTMVNAAPTILASYC